MSDNPVENGRAIADNIRASASAAGVPAWIAADPSGISPVLRPAQQFLRLQCDAWSGLTPVLRTFSGQFMNDMCGQYLGPDATPSFSPGQPPFTGGQCVGILYRVFLDLDNNGTVVTDASTLNERGPIQGLTRTDNGNGTFTTILNHGPDGGGNTTSVVEANHSPNRVWSVNRVSRFDGNPDNCGDPPAEPDEFEPGPNPRPAPTNPTTYNPPGGGPSVQINVDGPTDAPGGSISLTGSIGEINIDLGDLTGAGAPPLGDSGGPPQGPDYDNPGEPDNPGEDGDEPDEINEVGPVAAVTVSITTEPPNSSREVGGSENIFIEGVFSDAGWFRWIVADGFTPRERITSRQQHFIFSVGECREADGYQVKFSQGYSGNATAYRCEQQEQE